MTPTATITRPGIRTASQHRAYTSLDLSFVRGSGSTAGTITETDQVWPQRIRRIIRARLMHWSRPDLTDSAELLATELVTNALKHGCGDLGVRMYPTADRLRIEVRDGSHEFPVPRTAAPDDEDGRGLLIVIATAEDWGVSHDGTTTWCTLLL
ncbi:ATP-binding protein [Streptomyces sp. IB201691-2A2]|uniref:ATP-binding protein n=1 Tax=Streptomyces sp. IB201691-2A2 TaxID=2561920 RepID=UPI0021B12C14|nr:ATP-binding protein [Streptomyces sp. IB201691-2A2]